MAPHSEEAATPDPVEKGFATVATLRVGVKAMARKNDELRKAEILSVQERKGGLYFYVHYEEFNKRLDEWISSERFDLSKEVEWPAPEKPEKKAPKSKASLAEPKKNLKRSRSKLDREVSDTPEATSARTLTGVDSNGPESLETPRAEDFEMDLDTIQDATTVAQAAPPDTYSREEEIEKLRTSGSMTQNLTEISRVRNIDLIQLGKFNIVPWYFSPYPESLTHQDLVYICEFCLGYYAGSEQFLSHRNKCTLRHPPGNEIYRDGEISFFEIDGRRQLTYCRNLCLLAKLFLDHKTVYYDVDPFLFYCMTQNDEYGCHLVGYFSKEKESAEGYNVACILTLPQYQRKGYGKLLIAFSYELSRREQKLGSPEKPLSDLGLLSYRAYWQETIAGLLINGHVGASVEDLAHAAAMTPTDVVNTLQHLNMLRAVKTGHVIVLTKAVREQYEKQKEVERVKGKRAIDPTKLQWKPPTLTLRTWAW
ncbi:histone acetyltransferase ESA1 [Trichodelitschia bisporula]|uniref:Histone acetyltransferase ESA1 n=1 Tax=Trichodelitschia bisporula TaxID=703511 RepID=A0A6G1HL80_9PEZI|nr:histone acetyltransferase ESA1 [Trichodelitschia bisporula]